MESVVDQFGAGGQYSTDRYYLAVPALVEYPEPHVPVDLDFKPQSCPNPFYPGQNGVETAAILGTATFDVHDIDVASLQLVLPGGSIAPIPDAEHIEDVATPLVDPEPCECTTAGPDGFEDLTVKFDSEEIAAALGDVAPGQQLEMRITGTLLDGTPFEGAACVFIAGPVPADQTTWGAIKALYR